MAPKKANVKASAKVAADDDRKSISAMITQAKTPTATENQKSMLQLYQSYPRFDARKKEIIAQWKNDKTCAWIKHYSETNTQSNEVVHTSLHGYGTMSIP